MPGEPVQIFILCILQVLEIYNNNLCPLALLQECNILNLNTNIIVTHVEVLGLILASKF